MINFGIILALWKRVSNPPSSPFVKRGKYFYPPFGKGRWGGILKDLFQTAKLIPILYFLPC
jgi:hypothetical protein